MSDESKIKQKVDRIDDLEREASYFSGKDYFDNDGAQNVLVFRLVFSSFKRSGANISSWRSSGIYDDGNVILTAVSNSSSVVPRLINENGKLKVSFSGNLLKQTKVAYNHGRIINIYIVYKLQKRSNDDADMTLENSLFGAVKITNDVNTSKYRYSGYGISFDSGSSFSHPTSEYLNAKNVIVFGCDLSSSAHPINRKNNILVLGKDFIQGVNGTTIYSESMCKTDFTEQNKKFVLSLHYNDDDSYLLCNGVQQYKFKTKNSEISRNLLCLGNISTEFSTTNMQKTGLYGSVYDFSVDYRKKQLFY